MDVTRCVARISRRFMNLLLYISSYQWRHLNRPQFIWTEGAVIGRIHDESGRSQCTTQFAVTATCNFRRNEVGWDEMSDDNGGVTTECWWQMKIWKFKTLVCSCTTHRQTPRNDQLAATDHYKPQDNTAARSSQLDSLNHRKDRCGINKGCGREGHLPQVQQAGGTKHPYPKYFRDNDHKRRSLEFAERVNISLYSLSQQIKFC